MLFLDIGYIFILFMLICDNWSTSHFKYFDNAIDKSTCEWDLFEFIYNKTQYP